MHRFRTFSSGFLIGKTKLPYNFTQTIQCTPNKDYLSTTNSPVRHFKQLYPLPIYDENQRIFEWTPGPLIESKESRTCPIGFELKNSFCHVCDNCEQTKICEIGYRRNIESGLCEDIDECFENANICQYMCENQLGTYRCHCPIGFKMNDSGQCYDVNECKQFQIDCGQDRTCFNTRGAYECLDIPCPVGYVRQNENDCLLKCYHRLSSSCSARRAIYIRYKFFALSRLTSSNQTIFILPIAKETISSLKLFDKNPFDKSFPFSLNDFKVQTNRTLTESNEYEFEIHLSTHQNEHRQRLHTIFILRINISPFHF